ALTERTLVAIRDQWAGLVQQASRLTQTLLADAEALRAAKTCTETVLTPLLLNAPVIRRAYTKPLGYPGAYEVMHHYYANRPEGPSVFSQVMHKLVVEHPLSNGVRARKDFVLELLVKE